MSLYHADGHVIPDEDRGTYMGAGIIDGFGSTTAPINLPLGDSLTGGSTLAAHYNAERVFGETLLSDAFTRADGALGSVPGPGDPVAWSVLGGSASIVSNQAVLSGASTNHAVVEAGMADGVVSATVVNPNATNPGVAFRHIDIDNHLLVSVTPSELRLYKRDVVNFQLLASLTGLTIPNNALLTVAFKGDVIRMFVDGVFLLAHTLSGADYTKFGAATKVGIRGGATATTLDNFTVRTLAPSTDLAAAVDTFDRSTAAEIIDLSGTRAGGTGTGLRLPPTSYAGNGARTPTTAATKPTGDFDLRLDLKDAYGWQSAPSATAIFGNEAIYVYPHSAGGGGRWQVAVRVAGAYVYYTATANPASTDTKIRITRVAATGVVTFYEWVGGAWVVFSSVSSTAGAIDYGGLGAAFVGAGSTHAATAPFGGILRSMEFRSGIDGTIVASPDFTAQTAGTTSFADAQGNTWTINQSHGSIGSTETGEAAALAWVRFGGNDNVIRNGTAQASTFSGGGEAAVNTGLADVDVSADVVSRSGSTGCGLVLRGVAAFSQYLYLRLNPSTNAVELRKRDGAHSDIASAAFTVTSGVVYTVRAVLVGDRAWFYINGSLVFTHTFSAGDQITFGSATNHGAIVLSSTTQHGRVDNFRVSRPPLVACWPDLSGKHHHAVQTTTAAQPVLLTNIKNGRPVARFDGVNDYLRKAFSAALTQPNTVLAAAVSTSVASQRHMVDGNTATVNRHVLYNTATNWGMFAGTTMVGGTSDTNWHAHAGVFNTTSSKRRVDGAQVAAASAGTMTMSGLTIGSDDALSTHFWPGDIAEIVVADANLEATGELTAAENYLIRRWT